jgi:hypothetical protein
LVIFLGFNDQHFFNGLFDVLAIGGLLYVVGSLVLLIRVIEERLTDALMNGTKTGTFSRKMSTAALLC